MNKERSNARPFTFNLLAIWYKKKKVDGTKQRASNPFAAMTERASIGNWG
jgi:hypothetical protein